MLACLWSVQEGITVLKFLWGEQLSPTTFSHIDVLYCYMSYTWHLCTIYVHSSWLINDIILSHLQVLIKWCFAKLQTCVAVCKSLTTSLNPPLSAHSTGSTPFCNRIIITYQRSFFCGGKGSGGRTWRARRRLLYLRCTISLRQTLTSFLR